MGEAAKRLDLPTEYHVTVDEMLSNLAALTGRLKETQTAFQEELDLLILQHRARVAPLKQKVETLEKAVKGYAKKHQVDLFQGRDRVDLTHGALLHEVAERVRRARDVLERLEEIGATEAIKIAKSVDWDVLETWTDERLIEIGTERGKKETFAYELFGGSKKKGKA